MNMMLSALLALAVSHTAYADPTISLGELQFQHDFVPDRLDVLTAQLHYDLDGVDPETVEAVFLYFDFKERPGCRFCHSAIPQSCAYDG